MSRVLVLALAAATLAACGDDAPVREPVELAPIESPAVAARVLWDKSPGIGNDELHTRLRLAVEPDLLVTADVAGEVTALDPKNGRQLWRTTLETDTRSQRFFGLFTATDTARIVAGPSILGPLVLVGTLDAEVIALKREDGTPAWRVKVSSEVMAPPMGEAGMIVVRCVDGRVFGLSAETGARKWTFDRSVPPLTLRGLSAPLIENGVAYLGLDSGRLVALRVDSGEVLWEEVVATPTGRTELERIVDVDAEPLSAAGGIFAVSFGGELAAIGIADGRVAWRRPVKSHTGIALAGKVLTITDEDGLIWALDAETGASTWKQEALKYRKLSAPLMVGEYVAVADFEGYVHFLSPQDGRIVGRLQPVTDPVQSALVAGDGVLYVLDEDGDIAAIEARALNAEPRALN
jgi:outer membrane protein assembly factor BamB